MKKTDVVEEELTLDESDAKGADLIITLTDRLRVLVFRSNKEYLLQESISRTGTGKGKRAKGEKYEVWVDKGSLGNIEQVLKLAARLSTEIKCLKKREVDIREFLRESRRSNAELSEILKGV